MALSNHIRIQNQHQSNIQSHNNADFTNLPSDDFQALMPEERILEESYHTLSNSLDNYLPTDISQLTGCFSSISASSCNNGEYLEFQSNAFDSNESYSNPIEHNIISKEDILQGMNTYQSPCISDESLEELISNKELAELAFAIMTPNG